MVNINGVFSRFNRSFSVDNNEDMTPRPQRSNNKATAKASDIDQLISKKDTATESGKETVLPSGNNEPSNAGSNTTSGVNTDKNISKNPFDPGNLSYNAETGKSVSGTASSLSNLVDTNINASLYAVSNSGTIDSLNNKNSSGLSGQNSNSNIPANSLNNSKTDSTNPGSKIGDLIDTATSLPDKAIDAVRANLGNTAADAASLASDASSLVSPIGQAVGVVTAFKDAVNSNPGGTIGEIAGDTVVNVIDNGANVVKETGRVINDALSSVGLGAVGKGVSFVTNAIGNGVSAVGEAIGGAIGWAINGIGSLFGFGSSSSGSSSGSGGGGGLSRLWKTICSWF